MDKSPKFLKMCMKAEEIQKIWKLSDDDFYIVIKGLGKRIPSKFCILNDWETKSYIIDHRDSFIWIPRLDQVQKMIDWTKWEYRIKKKVEFEMYYTSISGEQNSGMVTGASMEQLWLSFLMREKYGKVWDAEKEEWIKVR
jgi:hypothetical protein